jgi:hypothetical protein
VFNLCFGPVCTRTNCHVLCRRVVLRHTEYSRVCTCGSPSSPMAVLGSGSGLCFQVPPPPSWCRLFPRHRPSHAAVFMYAPPCQNSSRSTENYGNNTSCCSNKGTVCAHCEKTQAAKQCIIEAWRAMKGGEKVAGQ